MCTCRSRPRRWRPTDGRSHAAEEQAEPRCKPGTVFKRRIYRLSPEKQPRPAALLRLHRQQVLPVEGGRAARHPVLWTARQHLHECTAVLEGHISEAFKAKHAAAGCALTQGYPPAPAGKASPLVCLLERVQGVAKAADGMAQTSSRWFTAQCLRALASVVLPLPLRPISAAASPACTAKFTPYRAVEEWDRAHESSVIAVLYCSERGQGQGCRSRCCCSLSARTPLTCSTCRPATAAAALRAAAPRPVGVTAAVSSRTSSKGWELVPWLEGCSLSWGAAARAAAAAAAARPAAERLTACRRAPHRLCPADTMPARRFVQPKLASASRGGPTPGRAPSPQARQAIWCSHGVRYNAMAQSTRQVERN